jgi:hypothetical protein
MANAISIVFSCPEPADARPDRHALVEDWRAPRRGRVAVLKQLSIAHRSLCCANAAGPPALEPPDEQSLWPNNCRCLRPLGVMTDPCGTPAESTVIPRSRTCRRVATNRPSGPVATLDRIERIQPQRSAVVTRPRSSQGSGPKRTLLIDSTGLATTTTAEPCRLIRRLRWGAVLTGAHSGATVRTRPRHPGIDTVWA